VAASERDKEETPKEKHQTKELNPQPVDSLKGMPASASSPLPLKSQKSAEREVQREREREFNHVPATSCLVT
jgi:hypothetical protein